MNVDYPAQKAGLEQISLQIGKGMDEALSMGIKLQL